MDSPIYTISGIGRRMGAMILSEVVDFSNFASADKLLAYAGLSPSTYQSDNCKTVMHTWKNAAHDIYAMLFSMLLFVYGVPHSLLILKRNELKENTTMLLSLMPLKNR